MTETIYDHPRYYDLLFGWDRTPEVDFYAAVFEQAGIRPDERILEVACGPGRVARALARRGLRLAGVDLRPEMARYLAAQAEAEGLAIESFTGDMRRLALPGRFAAAYNPMSSFRLLQDDASAREHLGSIARCLRPGGVYVLDLELAAPGDPELQEGVDETWSMSEGELSVHAEVDRVRVRDGARELELAWGEEAHLRRMEADHVEALVGGVDALRLAAWFPEVEKNEADVSTFDPTAGEAHGRPGRTMALLQRT